MSEFQFGGPLGAIFDSQTKLTVNPRCLGSATVPFEANDQFVAAARPVILKHVLMMVQQATQSGKSIMAATASPDLAAIAGAAGAELGVQLQIGMVNVNFSEEDRDAYIRATNAGAAANRAAAMAKMNAPAAPAPPAFSTTTFSAGARVMATWQDGRAFPATVRSFNGTHYEVVWDGATESTWIVPENIRPT